MVGGENLFDETLFEQKSKCSEKTGHTNTWGKNVACGGYRSAQALENSRNNKEVNVQEVNKKEFDRK